MGDSKISIRKEAEDHIFLVFEKLRSAST